jgi:hypothetical protein
LARSTRGTRTTEAAIAGRTTDTAITISTR